MIAFAEIHPGWFAVVAIAVECAIIFGLMALLPRLAMEERPAWMDFESESACATPFTRHAGTESASPRQSGRFAAQASARLPAEYAR